MSGKAIRETLAALAVVASLVFVGLEIQQNTVASQAEQENDIFDASRCSLASMRCSRCSAPRVAAP